MGKDVLQAVHVSDMGGKGDAKGRMKLSTIHVLCCFTGSGEHGVLSKL